MQEEKKAIEPTRAQTKIRKTLRALAYMKKLLYFCAVLQQDIPIWRTPKNHKNKHESTFD